METPTLTRQDILEIWYAAYLDGDRDTFSEAESILHKHDNNEIELRNGS